MKRKIIIGINSLALLAGLLTLGLSPVSAETIRIPKSNMLPCTDQTTLYCVEGVTITTPSGSKIPLVYVPAGKPVPAEKLPTDFFAPVARLKGGKVIDNNWWTSQYQRDVITSGNVEIRDISSLLGTANFPEQGAKYDPNSKLFDITKPLDTYDYKTTCWDTQNQLVTDRSFRDCYKGAMAILQANEVKFLWLFPAVDNAVRTTQDFSDSLFVDLAEMAVRQLRPAIGATYDPATKTFSQTEPLVIPTWLKDESLRNGWAVAGSSAATPQKDPSTPSTTTPVATTEAKELAQTAPLAPEPGVAVSTPAEAGRAMPGRWTHPKWHELNLGALGYDGLMVEARAANEFVTSILLTDVLPTLTDKDFKVNLAGQVGNKSYAVGLDSDLLISAKIRIGNMKTGITVAVATDASVDQQQTSQYNTITITGSPVTVALAAKAADCIGETGVAKANTRQFQMIAYAQNDDRSGFGIDGISGDMNIASNGVCALSTPTWNEEAKEFTWSAAAPHFAADGVTVNRGFYKAIIPADDAYLLWGLANPLDAATALQISLTTEAGGTAAALKNVSVKNGRIIIDVSGFEYSRPKLRIGIKANYKPSKATIKRTSITCVKGKAVRKINAVKPTCPPGYKKQ